MFVEVIGTGKHNLGAEMMLRTVIESEIFCDDFDFVFPVNALNGGYSFYKNLNVYPKAQIEIRGYTFSSIFNYLPKKLLNLFGLIKESDIKAIFDLSGFAYSSDWGDQVFIKRLKYYKKMKKRGCKIILFPQAYGPFTPKQKIYFQKIISIADQIYVRDKKSMEHIGVSVFSNKLKIIPDFTLLNEYTTISKTKCIFETNEYTVVVPNHNISDRIINAEKYVSFFIELIQNYDDTKNLVFIPFGGDKDLELCNKIIEKISKNHNISILEKADSRDAINCIASSKLLIGSRYHAILAALNSEVPALSIGWSHKYNELYDEFGIGNLNFDVTKALPVNNDSFSYNETINLIKQKNNKKRDILNKMFSDVREILCE